MRRSAVALAAAALVGGLGCGSSGPASGGDFPESLPASNVHECDEIGGLWSSSEELCIDPATKGERYNYTSHYPNADSPEKCEAVRGDWDGDQDLCFDPGSKE